MGTTMKVFGFADVVGSIKRGVVVVLEVGR